MKVRSSQSDLSQDTDATHEYADSCIGMPMSSDSYDKIRQDWIDDWNKYIDALDGRNLTKQNSNHEASNEVSLAIFGKFSDIFEAWQIR